MLKKNFILFNNFYDKHSFALNMFIIGVLAAPELLFCQEFLPHNYSLQYSKYTYFQWRAIPDAKVYQLQIAHDDLGRFEENLIISLDDDTHGKLVKESLEFGNDYRWRVRAVLTNGDTVNWSKERYFGVVVLPDSIRDGFTPTIAIPEEMQPGITISSPFGIPVGIKHDGEVVWYLPGKRHWNDGQWALSQLKNGEFISLHRGGIRVFNVNNDTLEFISPADFQGMHHEVVQTSKRNFLTLIPSMKWISNGSDSILWKGDRLIELNREGELIWSWDCWNYLSIEDFDRVELSRVPPGGIFDWTHTNAAFLNEKEDAIYLSIRNLSRVIKIEYPSGDIVWSMGQQMASGDVDFGYELEFYRQHAPEVLADESILLYDNHWITGEVGEFSRAIKIGINLDNPRSADIEWQFKHQFSRTQGDINRLDNGNILINTGSSFFYYELNNKGEIVWEVEPNLNVGNYRAERITSLFPLIYTVSGPVNGSFFQTGDNEVSYKINNEGEVAQEYAYLLTDEDGFIVPKGGKVQIPPTDSNILTFQFYLHDDIGIMDLIFTVIPVADKTNEFSLKTTHSVRERKMPEIFDLNINCHPNPFNNSAVVTYSLFEATEVTISLHDINGRHVKELGKYEKTAGVHTLEFKSRNLESGIFLVRIETNKLSSVSKLILMK